MNKLVPGVCMCGQIVIMEITFSGGMPTIVPGSSHAATILEEAAPYLGEMGIPVDLDCNADMITTAMYPNGVNGNVIRVEKKELKFLSSFLKCLK